MKDNIKYIKELEGKVKKLTEENEILQKAFSDSKLANRKIRKLSAAIIQSPVSILITDLDANIEYVNPQFTKVTGYSLDEVEGKNPRILKTDTKTKEEYAQLYKDLLAGKVWNGEFLNKKKDGSLYWELAIISPIKDEKGEIVNFVGVKEDITKRKEYEKEILRLNTAVIQSPASIIITDTDGNIEYANPVFLKKSGYTYEEVIGKNPRILKSGYTTDKEYKTLWETIISGKVWNGEFLNMRKDGSKYWELATISPIIDDDRKIINYIAVKEDITKQKQIEDALTESNTKLQEANVTKDKFFSIIAHDLKSPIGALLNMVELLNNSYDTFTQDEIKYWINALYQSSSNTFNLLENLLTWSSIQRNAITYNPQHFDLFTLIDDNLDLLEASRSKKNISIKNNSALSIFVFADKQMITAVIRNLLSNAIKFTRIDGNIQINTELLNNDFVKLNISDDGIGMSEDKISQLFKLDIDISTKGTDGEKGTGLGLILCKEFIDKNKGKIWVESEEGKGSKFSFTIPLNS
ncbi:PAS domain S-box protein [Bacteroidota bacterium]